MTQASTSDRIHRAALRLFATYGFEGTGIRKIADEAGITVASLYHYVGTKEDLLAAVWGSAPGEQGISTVTEHVRRVRQKIEVDPDAPRWIVTVRGIGYRFEP